MLYYGFIFVHKFAVARFRVYKPKIFSKFIHFLKIFQECLSQKWLPRLKLNKFVVIIGLAITVGFRVVKDMNDGFINATKMCKDGGKRFCNWTRLQASTELDEYITQICWAMLARHLEISSGEEANTLTR